MQLTERFKLRKIEPGDFFLPNDLNGGTDQMEEALRIAHAGAVEEHDQRTRETAALDQRVTLLEAKKMVVGVYTGSANQQYSAIFQTINLDFTPFAVVVFGLYPEMALLENPGYSVEITETGFRVHNSSNTGIHSNLNNQRYTYIAFG